MLFRKNAKMIKKYKEDLIQQVYVNKDRWMNNKQIVEKCVEPTDELLHELRISEVKYLYVLREIKKRKVSLKN